MLYNPRYRPPPANVDQPSAGVVPTNGADPGANNYDDDDAASTGGDVNCDEAEGRCSAMRCPYGTLRYYDDRTKCEGKHLLIPIIIYIYINWKKAV